MVDFIFWMLWNCDDDLVVCVFLCRRQVYKCWAEFYQGKPRATYLFLTNKALHVAFSRNKSAVAWSVLLIGINQVTVRI